MQNCAELEYCVVYVFIESFGGDDCNQKVYFSIK